MYISNTYFVVIHMIKVPSQVNITRDIDLGTRILHLIVSYWNVMDT